MEFGVDVDAITFDASAKTITMSGYYSDLGREQITHIKNLTTGDTLYNALFPQKYNIAVSAGVITHTYDNSNHQDTDIIQVTFVATESMGYNSDVDSLKVVEQAPLDQQILDELLLDAVTATANSTYVDCSGFGGFTLHIEATGTVNFTIEAHHTTDNTSTAPSAVGLVNAAGTASATPITLSAAGEYTYQFANLATAKYVRARVVITTGTASVTLLARALGGE